MVGLIWGGRCVAGEGRSEGKGGKAEGPQKTMRIFQKQFTGRMTDLWNAVAIVTRSVSQMSEEGKHQIRARWMMTDSVFGSSKGRD